MRFFVRFVIRVLPVLIVCVLYAIRKRKERVAREENQKQQRASVIDSEKLWEDKAPLDFVKNIAEGGARMEIEDLTPEQAKEIFNSAKGQETWKVTEDLLGPTIELAYQDDYIARLLLCGTLGAIFVREDKDLGSEGIVSLEKRGVTAYDKAVCILTKGIYYEVFEEYGQAIECYKKAIKKYAGTYSAYLRLASIAYRLSGFDAAEKFCTQGLSQLEKDKLCDQIKLKEIEMQFRELLNQILKEIADKKDKEVYRGKPLEEIWKIEDPTDFAIALNDRIWAKCRGGNRMSALSGPERVVLVVLQVDGEVNNGGFDQFFFNSSGDFANEIVDAFSAIGAVKTAEICKKAVSIYGGTVPPDRDARDEFLDDEENAAILDECDTAFYKNEENVDALIQTYVLKNKEFFS